jgi:hypothetical protein
MTIAILSWGSHKTLINTLESYKKFNLNDTEKLIFFQEISKRDIEIAEEYGYLWQGDLENVGIAEAYKALVEHATGELFLFLENDWELLEPPEQQLAEASRLLLDNTIDIARFRHRQHPGNPLWTRQFEGNEMSRPEHLLDSIHWTNPDKFESVQKGGQWYITTAEYANWTNNPHMARTDFLRKEIVPRLSGDIEKSLQEWWQQQSFVVTQGDGLFTHNRIG